MYVIDIHTHGFGPYDTAGGDCDDIVQIAGHHALSGVDAIVPTIYSSSAGVMRRSMAAVKKAMDNQRKNALSPDKDGAHTILGVHLEGPYLNPARAGALDERSFLSPSVDNYMRLVDGFEDIIRIVTLAPELGGSLELIEFLSAKGVIASMGHSDATYSEAEAGHKAGACGVTHIFNAMRAFHHREVGIAGFALMNPDIYIEVIGDPYHLSDRLIEFIFKTKNPERIVIVSDMVRGSTGDGNRAPRDGTGRLLGGSMTLTRAAARLKTLGIDRQSIEKAMSENPKRYLASRQ